MRLFLAIVLSTVLLWAPTGCGDSADGGCPGRVCNNCAASGDCDLECAAPKLNFCGHFGLFDDPNLRCTFCEDPDFEF